MSNHKKIVAYSKKAPWVDRNGVKHEGYILWEYQNQGVLGRYYQAPKHCKEPMPDFLRLMLK